MEYISHYAQPQVNCRTMDIMVDGAHVSVDTGGIQTIGSCVFGGVMASDFDFSTLMLSGPAENPTYRHSIHFQLLPWSGDNAATVKELIKRLGDGIDVILALRVNAEQRRLTNAHVSAQFFAVNLKDAKEFGGPIRRCEPDEHTRDLFTDSVLERTHLEKLVRKVVTEMTCGQSTIGKGYSTIILQGDIFASDLV